MGWTSTKQKGTPGHCYAAQVFDANGRAIVTIEPTEDEDQASKLAELIATLPDLIAGRTKSEEAEKVLISNFNASNTAHWEVVQKLQEARAQLKTIRNSTIDNCIDIINKDLEYANDTMTFFKIRTLLNALKT